jgi:hypothetical protein
MMRVEVYLGALLCELTVATVFLASGAAKSVDTAEFANTLVALGVPARCKRTTALISHAIPGAEIALGLLTVARVQAKLTSLSLLIFAGLFTLVTAWATRRRVQVQCRCFGSLTRSQFGRRGLAVNVALMVMAMIATLYEWRVEPTILVSIITRIIVTISFGGFAVAAGQAALVLPSLSQTTEVAQ